MSICCGQRYTFSASGEGSELNNMKGGFLSFGVGVFSFFVLKDWAFSSVGCFESDFPVSFLGRLYFPYVSW